MQSLLTYVRTLLLNLVLSAHAWVVVGFWKLLDFVESLK